MSDKIEDQLSEISTKIVDSGVVQKGLQLGKLAGLTLYIQGDEDAWDLVIYLFVKDRDSSEFFYDEEDDEDERDNIFYPIQNLIEEQLEEDFEEIGFFANERETIRIELKVLG